MRLAFPWPSLAFLGGLSLAWGYLPIALPFALATVVGGIDNTESAAAAVAPILIYIGIEVVAQAFAATPARHGPAVSLALLPSLAFLVGLEMSTLLSATGARLDSLGWEMAETIRTLGLLGNGFITSALLWGAATAELIDGRFRRSGAYFLAGAALCLFGVIHSPAPQGTLFLPWQLDSSIPFHFALAYGLAGLTVAAASFLPREQAAD